MKIKELIETGFSSDKQNNIVETYRNLYETEVEYFDLYVQRYGTDGANIKFTRDINATKDELINFTISQDESYADMIKARNRLEEKIKSANGLSY
jgi:hypothetical protein